MLKIIIGVLLIFGGVVWFLMSAFAAGMASRSTTQWEGTIRPLLGIIPVLLGVAIMIWG